MEGPDEGEELSAREAAAALGVSERTVLNYVKRGLLEARTTRRGFSRRHTFTAQAVEACKRKLESRS